MSLVHVWDFSAVDKAKLHGAKILMNFWPLMESEIKKHV
jgi:hypothetical protein